MSVIVLALSISFRWSILTLRSLQSKYKGVIEDVHFELPPPSFVTGRVSRTHQMEWTGGEPRKNLKVLSTCSADF